MAKKLSDIEGIAASYSRKLKSGKITSVNKLLERGRTPKGRDQIVKECDISKKLVLKWVNHADLFRVKGVAGQYAELLESSGVDTVVELSHRKPENLYAAMKKTNASKHLCKRPPAPSMVARWVKQAKKLPRVVSY